MSDLPKLVIKLVIGPHDIETLYPNQGVLFFAVFVHYFYPLNEIVHTLLTNLYQHLVLLLIFSEVGGNMDIETLLEINGGLDIFTLALLSHNILCYLL